MLEMLFAVIHTHIFLTPQKKLFFNITVFYRETELIQDPTSLFLKEFQEDSCKYKTNFSFGTAQLRFFSTQA